MLATCKSIPCLAHDLLTCCRRPAWRCNVSARAEGGASHGMRSMPRIPRHATHTMHPTACDQCHASQGMPPTVCIPRHVTNAIHPTLCDPCHASHVEHLGGREIRERARVPSAGEQPLLGVRDGEAERAARLTELRRLRPARWRLAVGRKQSLARAQARGVPVHGRAAADNVDGAAGVDGRRAAAARGSERRKRRAPLARGSSRCTRSTTCSG